MKVPRSVAGKEQKSERSHPSAACLQAVAARNTAKSNQRKPNPRQFLAVMDGSEAIVTVQTDCWS
ncbi:MAG: hypothetical protein K6T90_14885 [Leptolyngbyaceae cyanobacterium HOT.MB2.61]|nr:hypothetical protein [Leptolyngbyaceae cyanobacterium HOT.MB2.61]